VVLAAFALPLVAAGLTLMLGAGGGLYWLVPAMVLGFGGAVLNAWVLLVEIVR
jgi:modulator of FtsH protease